MSARARSLVIAASAAMASATAHADTVAPAAGHRLTFRVAPGVAYLHESWSPNDGNPGSVQSGWAPALEIAVGRVLSPRLVVGGLWQGASVLSLTESFAGTDYHITEVVKLSNLVGAFVEDPTLPRVPLRAGIALGLLGSSFYDTGQWRIETTFALAASPYVGYDHRLSKRWSVGALARLTLYRSVSAETRRPPPRPGSCGHQEAAPHANLRIPAGSGHRFRKDPGTDSAMTRALNPEHPGA